jgi:hypothetical protein
MSRLRDQDGFTIMEVLVAATVGFVVLAATLGLLESSARLDIGVISKTDAMQRGRLAMDRVTQELRSQVCLDYDNPAVLPASSENAVTYYGDFTEAGLRPDKRRVAFDPVKGTIVDYTYKAPDTAVVPLTVTDFPGAPTRTQLVLESVGRQVDKNGAPVPFFRYYANRLEGDGVYRPNEPLTAPLSVDDAKRVARIEVSFLALPTRASSAKQAVNLTDQVMARHLDPNVSLNPKCV